MQPQLQDDLLDIVSNIGGRLAITEKALTNDAVQVGMSVVWPATAGELPFNYHFWDGAALDRVGFAALFAEIGTDYGIGDGSTSFNLPTAVIETNTNQLISYVEYTANVTISGTNPGTGGTATTIVTAGAFTPNGTDEYWIEFFSPEVQAGSADSVLIELYDGATRLGEMAIFANPATQPASPCLVRRKLVPTNAAHTYSIRAWRVTNNGIVVAGNGTAGNAMPGYINITSGNNPGGLNIAMKIL